MKTKYIGLINYNQIGHYDEELRAIAVLMLRGGLISFPTETVYGLGALSANEKSVMRLYQVKERKLDHPISVQVAEVGQVEKVAREIPALFWELAGEFMPGPLTVVLKRNLQISSLVSGGLDTIAVRIPSNPIAQALLRFVKQPLVVSSANRSGDLAPITVQPILENFDGKIEAIIDGGKTLYGIESTILSLVDLNQPKILREGAIKGSLVLQKCLQVS